MASATAWRCFRTRWRADAAATFAKLTSPKAAADGFGMEVDENGIYVPRSLHNAYAEALWRIVAERPGQSYDTDWCDAPGKVFDDPPGQASEIAAVVNTGRGTGMLFPETYSAPLVDFAESIAKGEGHFRRFAKSVTDMVPAARGSLRSTTRSRTSRRSLRSTSARTACRSAAGTCATSAATRTRSSA